MVATAAKLGNVPPNLDTGKKAARAAGLRYATCDKPGITRHRRGKGFLFKGPRGQVIRDAQTLARVRALVLPPAWTDVWISTDPRAHLQATGHDAAGRKQYRYHADWTTERNSTKYHRMLAFAEVLPSIRKRTRRDLMGPACCRPRVLATVVELLGKTHIRIGNEEYARTNKSHGLTTLQDRHVKVRGRRLRFAFRGKSGVFQTIEIEAPQLAKAVQQCQDLPGQTVFQYRDDQRKVRNLSSSDINHYLGEISGGPFTAKDFRTWAGTLTAAQALDDCRRRNRRPRPTSDRRSRRSRRRNAGKYPRGVPQGYIHPAVLSAYLSGITLSKVTTSAKAMRLVERGSATGGAAGARRSQRSDRRRRAA